MRYRYRASDNLYDMADALVVLATLGFLNISRLRWRYYDLKSRILFRFQRRNWVTPGHHMTRGGRVVQVKANVKGWFDGLPFVIVDRNDRELYTVDESGFVWPQGGRAHREDLVPW